jgi:hypothetical protein
VKFIWSVPILICSLLAAAGVITAANALLPAPVMTAGIAAQYSAKDDAASADLSGSWQMSWTGQNGAQRQASMQIKQNGSKLTGKFIGERGSTSLSGSLDGDRVTLSLKMRRADISFSGTVSGDKMSGTGPRGGLWSATRRQQQ